MKYGIITDIHSNWEALEAVLKALEEDAVDKIVCLGDLVGYGADPERCIEEIADSAEFSVMGNHDSAVIGWENVERFNVRARVAASWARDRLSSVHTEYLKSLKYKEQLNEEVVCYHSSPGEPEQWHYLFSQAGLEDHFSSFNGRICFIGHTHVPVVFRQLDGKVETLRQEKLSIDLNAKYIVNAGSVGQPRDRDPRACYAIFDMSERIVEVKRIPYDIKTAQDKILAAGLPSHLAYRLIWGE